MPDGAWIGELAGLLELEAVLDDLREDGEHRVEHDRGDGDRQGEDHLGAIENENARPAPAANADQMYITITA